jgi:Uma2 family endonuclease
MSAIALSPPLDYPESDGRPLAETQVHGQAVLDLIHTLGRRYADVPDVYVWGNMLLYYVEGNPAACVAPDLFLVKGVDKRVRRVYKLWEEGRVPSLVIEVTSKSTRDEDMNLKKGLYERLGVEEYFLFDPFGEYLRPRLQGYRRENGSIKRWRWKGATRWPAGRPISTSCPRARDCACGTRSPVSPYSGRTNRTRPCMRPRSRSGHYKRNWSAFAAATKRSSEVFILEVAPIGQLVETGSSKDAE